MQGAIEVPKMLGRTVLPLGTSRRAQLQPGKHAYEEHSTPSLSHPPAAGSVRERSSALPAAAAAARASLGYRATPRRVFNPPLREHRWS